MIIALSSKVHLLAIISMSVFITAVSFITTPNFWIGLLFAIGVNIFYGAFDRASSVPFLFIKGNSIYCFWATFYFKKTDMRSPITLTQKRNYFIISDAYFEGYKIYDSVNLLSPFLPIQMDRRRKRLAKKLTACGFSVVEEV